MQDRRLKRGGEDLRVGPAGHSGPSGDRVAGLGASSDGAGQVMRDLRIRHGASRGVFGSRAAVRVALSGDIRAGRNRSSDRLRQVTKGLRIGRGGAGSSVDELAKLADLHKQGVLSDEEFAAQKAKILAS